MSTTVQALREAFARGRSSSTEAVRADCARIAPIADPGISLHLRPEVEVLTEAAAPFRNNRPDPPFSPRGPEAGPAR